MGWKDSIQKEELSQDSSWKNTIKPETTEPSRTEAALRGAGQGLSLGFADELAGLGEAGYKAVTGREDYNDFMQNYKKHRDESRSNFEAAEKAHPGFYRGGELTGGLTGFALAPGGTLAKLGAMGAAGSLGQEKDINSDTALPALGRAATSGAANAAFGAALGKLGASGPIGRLAAGAGAGAATGAALTEDPDNRARNAMIGGVLGATPVAVGGLASMYGSTPTGKIASMAYNTGENLARPEVQKGLNREITEAGEKGGSDLFNTAMDMFKQKAELIKQNSDKQIDPNEFKSQAEKAINSSISLSDTEKETYKKALKSYLREEKPTTFKGGTTPEKAPSEDSLMNTKEQNNPLELNPQEPQNNSITPTSSKDMQSYGVDPLTLAPLGPKTPMSNVGAMDQLRKQYGELLNTSNASPVDKKLYGLTSDEVNAAVPEAKVMNEKVVKARNMLEEAGLSSDIGERLEGGQLTPKDQSDMRELMTNSITAGSKDTPQGINAQKRMESVSRALNILKPGLGDELSQNYSNLSEKYGLTKEAKVNLVDVAATHFGKARAIVKAAPAYVAEKAGNINRSLGGAPEDIIGGASDVLGNTEAYPGIVAPKDDVENKDSDKFKPDSTKWLGKPFSQYRTENLNDLELKDKPTSDDFSRRLAAMKPDELQTVVAKLSGGGKNMQNVATGLKQALDQSDSFKQNAQLFNIAQNPDARKLLQSDANDTEES